MKEQVYQALMMQNKQSSDRDKLTSLIEKVRKGCNKACALTDRQRRNSQIMCDRIPKMNSNSGGCAKILDSKSAINTHNSNGSSSKESGIKVIRDAKPLFMARKRS